MWHCGARLITCFRREHLRQFNPTFLRVPLLRVNQQGTRTASKRACAPNPQVRQK